MRTVRKPTRPASALRGLGVAFALSLALTTSACGNETATAGADATPAADERSADTALGEGTWLVGITTAGGADGESAIRTYLFLDPSTGETRTRELPGVPAGSTSSRQAVLLVSGDRRWAIPDTGVARAEQRSGRLTVHSLEKDATTVLDLRRLTGRSDVRPVGWAFDPEQAATLRVVDDRDRVWTVPVAGGKATRAGSLPGGPWIFTNGFDPTDGSPWVESIESEETRPAGNGTDDTRLIERAGGTMLSSDSAQLAELASPPCRVGAAFLERDGGAWAFCADGPAVQAHHRPADSATWEKYGEPSEAVAPAASAMTILLPPAE